MRGQTVSKSGFLHVAESSSRVPHPSVGLEIGPGQRRPKSVVASLRRDHPLRSECYIKYKYLIVNDLSCEYWVSAASYRPLCTIVVKISRFFLGIEFAVSLVP